MAVVYKYYPPNDNTWDALLKGYLFFNKVSKQNDPYDASLQLIQSKEYMKRLEKVGMHPNAENIMKDYGTCSFAKSKDNKHLWTFYAENYSGLTIGFDEDGLINLAQDFMADIPYVKVTYTDEIPQVDDMDATFQPLYISPNLKVKPIKFSDAVKNDVNNDHRKDREHLFVFLCSLKEKATWHPEEETRLIAATRIMFDKSRLQKRGLVYLDNGYKIPFPKEIVKEIIIGHNSKFEKKKMKKLRQKYRDTPIFITSCERPFDIDIKPYN